MKWLWAILLIAIGGSTGFLLSVALRFWLCSMAWSDLADERNQLRNELTQLLEVNTQLASREPCIKEK